MWKTVLLGAALASPATALACPGKKTATADASHATAEGKDPAASAKKADLVKGNCSYTTGMMAQRVLDEGKAWTYAGRLASTEEALDSRVAAPFSVGPAHKVRVVANQVLEEIDSAGVTDKRLSLDGKVLEVDGVTYFVLTGYSPLNS